ncbi:MAG: stage III sporulation protein AF [Clostridia bacterium]|nr:stage III sporulation protein AF [Clostridia bacterium]
MSNWLISISCAAICGTLIEIITPVFKNGAEKYVKFIVALGVLLIILSPLSGIFSHIENNLDQMGINHTENNINVIEENKTQTWILTETLTNLENGIKKLVYHHFAVEVSVKVAAEITQNGIQVNSIEFTVPAGTPKLLTAEIEKFTGDYLGVKVYGKNGEK